MPNIHFNSSYLWKEIRGTFYILLFFLFIISCNSSKKAINGNSAAKTQLTPRERISLNDGWKFMKYTSQPDTLIYDERPVVTNRNDDVVADTKPTEAIDVISSEKVLKHWVLPTANNFIKDQNKHFKRPAANPEINFPFTKDDFVDHSWESVDLPHDWAIKGLFYKEANAPIGGGMGRLPIQGIAWYRKKLDISTDDKDKSIILEIDGAMSYAMVWLNGNLVGGWPYGYNSFQLDLTPYVNPGGINQLAIRLDNPPNSSRWYPGAGIYRNVWLTKVNKVHVAQWGSFVKTREISGNSATVDLAVEVENATSMEQNIKVVSEVFLLTDYSKKEKNRVAVFPETGLVIEAGKKNKTSNSVSILNPLLWGPPPTQKPNLYVVKTSLYSGNNLIDVYETKFGIRSLKFDPADGLFVNNIPVRIQGVNQHHDLGALGAAFNTRAAERQLELLSEMGCNAIRMAHNPPSPELLDLTDRLGFLVIDEVFDCWERRKTPLDFHLIFKDWYEADTRSFVRRDKNHPSVIIWCFGNEVGEQYTDTAGAALAKKLHDIVRDEDDTRPTTASMNYAKPDMPFPAVMDIITLNYQGEGIRDAPAYAHLRGIKTSPLYPAFKEKFPGKLIVSSETASALSTRGSYIFPVFPGNSAPVSDTTGGDPKNKYVSAYELYTAQFGASPDKVFASQDKHPFVAGEFVWSGWDYLGEPTPYYSARSSYCGIIDLAGFKKDRFYLYQSRWKPDLPMAHILPHWNWPDRIGKTTPVHVFTSGDEAELFLNGKSLGRKKKGKYEYRLRWDDVLYEAGELKTIAYKNGKKWAEDVVKTAGVAAKLSLSADRNLINADGEDLSFITVKVLDRNRVPVPDAMNNIQFSIEGPGEIVATDNGDPADMVSFASSERKAYFGMALVIVKFKKGAVGEITIRVKSEGLIPDQYTIKSK